MSSPSSADGSRVAIGTVAAASPRTSEPSLVAQKAYPFRFSNACVLIVPSPLLHSKLLPPPAARCIYLPYRAQHGTMVSDAALDRSTPLPSYASIDPADPMGEQRARAMVRKWVHSRVRSLPADGESKVDRAFLLFSLQHKAFSIIFTGNCCSLVNSKVLKMSHADYFGVRFGRRPTACHVTHEYHCAY